ISGTGGPSVTLSSEEAKKRRRSDEGILSTSWANDPPEHGNSGPSSSGPSISGPSSSGPGNTLVDPVTTNSSLRGSGAGSLSDTGLVGTRRFGSGHLGPVAPEPQQCSPGGGYGGSFGPGPPQQRLPPMGSSIGGGGVGDSRGYRGGDQSFHSAVHGTMRGEPGPGPGAGAPPGFTGNNGYGGGSQVYGRQGAPGPGPGGSLGLAG
ncbi:unnamed protein product, partial [Discosporangium mesarthrocarpum]